MSGGDGKDSRGPGWVNGPTGLGGGWMHPITLAGVQKTTHGRQG